MTKKAARSKWTPRQIKRASAAPPKEGSVRWSFRYFDPYVWDGEQGDEISFREIAQRLHETESRSWKDISSNKKRDHYVLASSMTLEARKRLDTSPLRDFDSLFRFRFTGTQRFWGARQGDYFLALWWDPEHKACPSTLKHT